MNAELSSYRLSSLTLCSSCSSPSNPVLVLLFPTLPSCHPSPIFTTPPLTPHFHPPTSHISPTSVTLGVPAYHHPADASTFTIPSSGTICLFFFLFASIPTPSLSYLAPNACHLPPFSCLPITSCFRHTLPFLLFIWAIFPLSVLMQGFIPNIKHSIPSIEVI